MLDRFYLIHVCIKKAVIDFEVDWTFEKEDINCIKETVEFICRRDINLIQVDVSLDLLLEHLAYLNTFTSKFLLGQLKIRIKERRTMFSDALM